MSRLRSGAVFLDRGDRGRRLLVRPQPDPLGQSTALGRLPRPNLAPGPRRRPRTPPAFLGGPLRGGHRRLEDFFPGLPTGRPPLAPRPRPGRGRRALRAGAGLARRAAGPLLPVLGGVALFTLLAYIFTPLTASGPEGTPEGFVWNLRYIAPALALGLVLVPLLPPLRGPRTSLVDHLRPLRRPGDPGLAPSGLGLRARAPGRSRPRCAGPRRLGGSPSARRPPARCPRGRGGGPRSRRDRRRLRRAGPLHRKRYANALEGFHLNRAIAWAKPVSGARIATAGRGGVFLQYGFYGDDLSNEVQWLGQPGPKGAWLPIETCEELREAVNEGDYEYAVTTYDRRFPDADQTSREASGSGGTPPPRRSRRRPRGGLRAPGIWTRGLRSARGRGRRASHRGRRARGLSRPALSPDFGSGTTLIRP